MGEAGIGGRSVLAKADNWRECGGKIVVIIVVVSECGGQFVVVIYYHDDVVEREAYCGSMKANQAVKIWWYIVQDIMKTL